MKKTLFHILNVLLVLVIFYFLGREFLAQWEQIKDYSFQFNIPLLLLSIVFYLIFFLFFALGWYGILNCLNHHIPFRTALCIFIATQPAKYIPGKIWTPVARIKFCQPFQVSTSMVFLSSGIEGALEIVAGFFVSLLAVFQIPDFGAASLWGSIAAVILGIVCLHPKIFYFFTNLFFKITKRELIAQEKRVSWGELLALLIPYVLGWIAVGIGSFFLLQAFYPEISPKHVIAITSLNAFSYVISMLALFAPSGLGVREGIWYALLKNITPSGIAIVYSIINRIWTILAELLFILLIAPFFLIPRKK